MIQKQIEIAHGNVLIAKFMGHKEESSGLYNISQHRELQNTFNIKYSTGNCLSIEGEVMTNYQPLEMRYHYS